MPYTRAWDETQPPGTALAATLDTIIQNFKTDTRERVAGIFGLNLAEFSADPIVPKTLTLSGAFAALNITVGAGSAATIGQVRLPNNNVISWRNVANSADLTLRLDATNTFAFDSSLLTNGSFSSTGLVTFGQGLSPTGIIQSIWGTSSVTSSIGTAFSSGALSLGYNTIQTGANGSAVDNWLQANVAIASALLQINNGTLAFFRKSLGAAPGTFAAFWGTPLFGIDSTGIAIPSLGKVFLDGGSDTYMVEAVANRIDLVSGGSAGLFVTSTFVAVPATNKFYFDGAVDTYVTEVSANVLQFVTGGTEAFRALSTAFIIPNASGFAFGGRSVIQSPADGTVLLTNNAGASFNYLQFGGTSNAFPLIKRNGTALNIRLADDSADANFSAAAGTFSGTITGSLSGTILTASQPNITQVGTLTNLSVSNNVITSGGSSNAGSMWASGVSGLILQARAGATDDFQIITPAGVTIMRVPTGTVNAIFAGTITGTFSGNVTGNVTGSSGSTTGNAATATALQTARAINGVNFDGTGAITVAAAAGTLTGAALAAGVTASSLTSVGTLTSLAVTGALSSGTHTISAGNTLILAGNDSISINGNTVVKGRQGGWSTQTTAQARADMGAAPVAATVYQTLAALIMDMRAHGLI